jgi:outer membrane biosynthesis protein TonB
VAFTPARANVIKALLEPRPQPKPEFKPWPVPTSSPRPAPSPQPVPSPQPSPDETAPSPDETAPPEPVYLVHPPRLKVDPKLMVVINALRRNSASQLALLSGGESMKFTSQSSLEDELHGISNRIHNYYLLSFTPLPAPTLGLHSLKVRVPDYPDAFIQTRRSYWSGIIETPPGEDRH